MILSIITKFRDTAFFSGGMQGAVGVGFSGVHKEAECAQSMGECAWCAVSIHQVWSECAQRESAPSVGEGTGCGAMVRGTGECVLDMGECAQCA